MKGVRKADDLLVCFVTIPLRPLTIHQLFRNNSVLAGDSSSGSYRVSHISLRHKNTTKGVGEKEQKTNEQYGLGLTQVQEGWFSDTAFPVLL